MTCSRQSYLGACLVATLCTQVTASVRAAKAPETAKPTSHTIRQIEGWTVRVDDRLFTPPNDALGTRALRFLEYKLSDIKAVVAAEPLAKLQAVTIVLDLSHGKLRSMQYHPDAGWLRENGYATNLVKCVHIPEAADLPTPRNITEQPWVVLHELAHAYHDQVLGFEEPRILKAYEDFKRSGRGDRALLYDGSRVRHYGLTDQKEFFAEMTESYFGLDDFFPFNRAELMTAEPEIYELMQAIWGPVAGKAARSAKGAGRTRRKPISQKDAATVLWYAKPAAKWSECWARLLDGQHANVCLANLVARQTCPNLFSMCFSAPQVEGAFGATAAIAEMPLQSQAGEIVLLPALPKAWAAGKVAGLRARGGFEVAITWQAGKLVAAEIRSLAGQPCRLRRGDRTFEAKIAAGESFRWAGN